MDGSSLVVPRSAPSARVWDGGGGGPSPPPPPPSDAQFPAGLRILVVDDDITCLAILQKMLSRCHYHVTICSEAERALHTLREKKGCFDLVLSDVHMPDMDGFKLLEQIGLEMDLPVIMMSADDGKDIVMKGVTHGACDYLIKPVSMDSLKNIWQHVVRKKRNELKELEQSGSHEENDRQQKRPFDDNDNVSSGSDGIWKNSKKRKEEEDETEEREDPTTMKKPRVVWSVDLHQQFVTAVNQLGVDKAVPKKILELMNIPGLTRENVASHLQKYRLYLRRVSGPQHQGRVDTSFASNSEATFSSISSLDGCDLQMLSVSSQLQPQGLMTLQSGPRRTTNTDADLSVVDQIGFFNPNAQNSNASKIRPGSGQQLNRQMDMVCGPSVCMEPRQLGQSQQMVQLYGNMSHQASEGMQGVFNFPSSFRTNSSLTGSTVNGHIGNSVVMQMTQQGQHFSLSQQQNHMQIGTPRYSPLRGQLLNGNACDFDSRVSSTGQHIIANGISGHVLGRGRNTTIGDVSLPGTYTNTSYSTVSPVPLAGSSYPLVNSTGASSLTSTGMIQGAGSTTRNIEGLNNVTSVTGMKEFAPHYDLFNELCYDSAQHLGNKQSNLDFGSSISTHKDFNATLKDGASRSTCTVRKEIFSIRAEIEREKVECVSQQNGTVLMENSIRMKAESMPDPSCKDVIFVDNNFPNELMSVIGRQQQEGAGQVEADFNFDGYSFEV